MSHEFQDGFEAADVARQDLPRPPHVVDRLADQYPARLTSKHLMAIFQVKQSWFSELLKRGKFDRFEIRPTIGRRAWSRELVQRYLDGDAQGSSRFHQKAS